MFQELVVLSVGLFIGLDSPEVGPDSDIAVAHAHGDELLLGVED